MDNTSFKQLLKDVIRSSFPEIKRTPVVIFVDRDDLFMGVTKVFGIFILAVDKEALKMPEDAIKGCLAHELCHVANWKEQSEREIDRMVINKGFAQELHAFLKWHDARYKSYKKKDGLTRKEVKKFL